jgi:hypothetical protein
MAFLAFNMRRSISVLTALCFLLAVPLLAQKIPEAPKPADYEDADGYAVLSVILDHYHSDSDPNFLLSPFQISSLTASGINTDSFEACAAKIPADFAVAAGDFRDRNKQNWKVIKKFNLKFNYKFSDLKGKRQPLMPTQNAKELPPPLFEDTVYQVSAVGFDATRTHAIAYVAAVCGPGCASGSYHLLVKQKEGWKETVSSPICEWMAFDTDFLSGRSSL